MYYIYIFSIQVLKFGNLFLGIMNITNKTPYEYYK